MENNPSSMDTFRGGSEIVCHVGIVGRERNRTMFDWLFKKDDARREFVERHPVGFLSVPKTLDMMPVLKFSREKFVAPKEVMLMDYCTKTEDQGNTPMCAGYAASLFAENVLWRRDDYPVDIPPQPIYAHAKTLDGDPDGKGTSLTAVLQSLIDMGIFDKAVCSINVIRNLEQVKYAIHKFGCCLVGFNISQEWYECDKKKVEICGKGDQTRLGGHAVLCCGYNRKGLAIANSWGEGWGHYGFAVIDWECAEKQFVYGAVLSNCLDGFKMN